MIDKNQSVFISYTYVYNYCKELEGFIMLTLTPANIKLFEKYNELHKRWKDLEKIWEEAREKCHKERKSINETLPILAGSRI